MTKAIISFCRNNKSPVIRLYKFTLIPFIFTKCQQIRTLLFESVFYVLSEFSTYNFYKQNLFFTLFIDTRAYYIIVKILTAFTFFFQTINPHPKKLLQAELFLLPCQNMSLYLFLNYIQSAIFCLVPNHTNQFFILSSTISFE